MKNPKYLVVVALVLGAALFGWLARDAQPLKAMTSGPAPVATNGELDSAVPATAAKAPTAGSAFVAASADARRLDWSKRLQESDDYWAFAESAIGPAKAGDGDARYWLALALNECQFVYSIYFNESQPEKPPRRLTLDEARQRVAGEQRSFYSADDLNLLEKRCTRLSEARDSPFGTGDEWMAAALAIGNPLAQSASASDNAFGGRLNPESEKARAARAEARRLSVEAVRTGDPEAMSRVGGVASMLALENEAEGKRRELSWLLAACLRTPDCEGLTTWKKIRCNWDSQCQPYETPTDIIRRDAGSDFDAVERRAHELNEKIDAGTLEESDI